MILECTACHARYLVPDQAIGAGRTVRCAECAHSWYQERPKTAPPLEDLDKMLEDLNARPKPEPIPPGSNLPVIPGARASLPLMLSTGVLGLIAASLLVLLVWPSVFQLDESRGMVLSDVRIHIIPTALENRTIYQINGAIKNTHEETMPVPMLRITQVDSGGKALQSWDYPPAAARVAAGLTIPFSTPHLDLAKNPNTRFVVELGNALELALRRRPGALAGQ